MLTYSVRTIIFYRTPEGNCPIEEFLDSLSGRQAKKLTWVLEIVETMDMVPTSYFKKLDGTDGVWEVRADLGSDAFRLLGFIHKGSLIVLTNGFIKKTQKTPPAQLALAEKRRAEYLERHK